MKKFESGQNTPFSVIFGHTLNISHFLNVILGLVPRIHDKHSPLLDTRVTPEYDGNGVDIFTPKDDKGLRLSTSILKHTLNVILGFIPRIHAKVDTRVTPEYDGNLMVDSRARLSVTPENDYKRSLTKGLDVVCQCAALLERRVQSGTRVRKAQAVTRQTNPIGRSMIEMLGVLAIIGVLSVGGIAGYSKAMMKFKINKTMQQIAEIVANVQTLYAQQKDFNGLTNETAVQMGIVPDSLTTSAERYYTTISNVFGGQVYIYYSPWRNERFFVVDFGGLPKEACIELATQNWGSATSSGIIGISVHDFSAGYDRIYIGCKGSEVLTSSDGAYEACSDSLPIPPSIAATYCQEDSNNIVLYYQ